MQRLGKVELGALAVFLLLLFLFLVSEAGIGAFLPLVLERLGRVPGVHTPVKGFPGH